MRVTTATGGAHCTHFRDIWCPSFWREPVLDWTLGLFGASGRLRQTKSFHDDTTAAHACASRCDV